MAEKMREIYNMLPVDLGKMSVPLAAQEWTDRLPRLMLPPQASRLARRFGYALIPDIIRSRLYDDHPPEEKVRTTAWLDGMRGYGAVVVFNFHYCYAFTDMSTKPFGTEGHNYLIELPVIRFLHGAMAPYIFFISAGYVLAIKPFQLMRINDSASRDKLLQTMSGSLFRRIIRIYIPVVAIMLITAISCYFGAFEPARPYFEQAKLYFPGPSGRDRKQLAQFPTLIEQLAFCCTDFWETLNFWHWGQYYPAHDPHLWTIRCEIRGSLILFGSLLTLARVKQSIRMAGLIVCGLYCIRYERLVESAFFFGAGIAQMDVMRQHYHELLTTPILEKSQLMNYLPTKLPLAEPLTFMGGMWESRCRWLVVFRWAFEVSVIVGPFYLMTVPAVDYATAPGYETLIGLCPEWYGNRSHFLSFFGNCLMVLLISWSRQDSLSVKFFANPMSKYLARIMFACYLVHGPIMHLFGYIIPPLIWERMGDQQESMFIWLTGISIGWLTTFLVVIWAADVFTREVIGRGFYAAFLLEKLCYSKEA